ncbi:hypothetical protein Efla_005800 [Eimeria flavescens]
MCPKEGGAPLEGGEPQKEGAPGSTGPARDESAHSKEQTAPASRRSRRPLIRWGLQDEEALAAEEADGKNGRAGDKGPPGSSAAAGAARAAASLRELIKQAVEPFSLEAFFALPLKMGGAYWASSALWILKLKSTKCKQLLADAASRTSSSNGSSSNGSSGSFECEEDADSGCSLDWLLQSREDALCDWILRCLRPCGGFAQDEGQEAHLSATHYALLLLAGLGRLHLLPSRQQTAAWIRSLQNADGGFSGDRWGESDSRFSYCGVASLLLLGELDGQVADRAVLFVRRLINNDSGFAWVPGGEAHAASAFCCLATLAVCGGLWAVDRQQAARWLAERQTAAGGFNGRPEKAPDVCYSFWIFASLQILGFKRWVDSPSLCRFILEAQDAAAGGIADRPADVADPFHTFFGLAALGMLGATHELEELDPVLALPASVVRQLGLPRSLV